MNLREQILNSKDIKSETIKVEEWGNAVIEIRGMSGKERANMLKNSIDKDGKADIEKLYPELIIATCFDPNDGKKLFEKTDRDILNSKASTAIEKVAKVAMRLSGMEAETIEEIEKN